MAPDAMDVMASISKKGVERPQRRVGALLGAGAASWICAAIIAANFDKGFWGGVQGWGRPYWWLDYRHGFVRRGLVGEIFQRLVGRLDEAHLVGPVTAVHLGCCLFLAGAALWLLFTALRTPMSRARALLVAAVGIWIAAAEFWPTVAYTEGYMDAIVLAVAVAAALFVRAKVYVAAGVLLFLGPFIHEYFVFLVPFVLLSEKQAPAEPANVSGSAEVLSLQDAPEPPAAPKHLFVLAAVALLAALIVTFGASAQATRLEIAAMPLTPVDKTMLVSTTLMQTVGQSFSASASQLFEHPAFTMRTSAFFLLPSLIAVIAMLFWRGRPTPSLLTRAAAGLFPLAALLLAWDLSRLLVMSNLTAGLLFLMVARDTPEVEQLDGVRRRREGWPAMALAGLLALAGFGYALLPLAYAYYRPGPVTFFPLKVWPGDGRKDFGLKLAWPYATTIEAHPSAPAPAPSPGPQAPGMLHQLHSNLVGAAEQGDGWRIPAHPGDALMLFGPYLHLPEGRYQVKLHASLQGGPARCRAAAKVFTPSISVTRDAGQKVVRPKAPAAVTLAKDDPCSLTVAAEFAVPPGGAGKVETPLYGATTLPLTVDAYALEPVAAAQSR